MLANSLSGRNGSLPLSSFEKFGLQVLRKGQVIEKMENGQGNIWISVAFFLSRCYRSRNEISGFTPVDLQSKASNPARAVTSR
jgi:hypothetical protein